jgi:THO complex subunit 2 N-terminus/Transcription- and export-related complex subunit
LWMCKTDVSNMVRNLGMLPGKKPTAIEPYKGYIVKRFSQLTPAEAIIEDAIGTKEEESQLIDNIFDPVMFLASSHEGVPDATLYLKLCHLIQSHLEISSKKEEHSGLSVRGITILQQFLLPSLSLYPTNPQLSQALWSCLQLLPFTKRYSLYDAWANGPRSLQSRIGTPFPLERNAISKTALLGNGCLSSDKPLWAALTEVIAGKETRSVLKRLSKETIREQSRRFAKVSSTAPIVAFSILIQQMQAYDNMIDLMVDSFQLCSDLSRDVLVWCLLQNLAGVDDGKLGR